MTTANDVVTIIEALQKAGVYYWLFGGWAVEAQLPAAARPHKDIDLVVELYHLDLARDAIEAEGYTGKSYDPYEHLRFTRAGPGGNVHVSHVIRKLHYCWLSVPNIPSKDGFLACPLQAFPVAKKRTLVGHDIRCVSLEVLLQSSFSWGSQRCKDIADRHHLEGALTKKEINRAYRNRTPRSRAECEVDCV